MSAEAPKEAGTTAPITPQKPEGGFSRFLRKLFDVPSESQQTQQSAPRIIQPPPGLEDFAAQIQQGVDGHLSAQGQQELDRQQAETARLFAEAAEKARVAADQRDLAEQERIKREEATAEAAKILRDFRIKEKLEYIRDTFWKGEGEVRVTPLLGVSRDGNQSQGGFELIYSFVQPQHVHDKWEHRVKGGRPMSRERWKIVTHEKSTKLEIAVIDERGEKVMRISSVLDSDLFRTVGTGFSIFEGDSVFEGKRIPVNAKDNTSLLEAAFVADIVERRNNVCFPKQMEEEVKRIYAFMRQHPAGEWTYDPPGECD